MPLNSGPQTWNDIVSKCDHIHITLPIFSNFFSTQYYYLLPTPHAPRPVECVSLLQYSELNG